MLVLIAMLAATQTANVPGLTEEYLRELYKSSPMTATTVGYHKDGVDRKLDDLSVAERKRRGAFLHDFSRRMATLDRNALSAEDRADLRLLSDNVALELLTLEQARDFARRPDQPIGALGTVFFNMMVRPYASAEARGADVAARLQKVPKYLEQARANLEVYVKPFYDAAKDDGQGLLEFLRDELPKAFAQSPAKGQVAAALPEALKAVESYLGAVAKLTKLPTQDFRYGRPLYDQRFGHYLQTDLGPDQVLASAERQIREVRAQMAKLARPLYAKAHRGQPVPADEAQLIKAVLDDIAKDHGTAEGFFEEAKADVGRERAFIEKKGLLTLPAVDNLQVVQTPPFMRSTYGVAGFDGAPPLMPELGAFYYVTPFPKEWTPDKVESKLREYNKWNLELISIHEAMPGHFVQFQWANHVQPEARRVARWLLSSTAYVEGWAVFAEDLMVAAGYLKDPRMELTYLKGTLRMLANTVLDIRLQSRGMSEEEAMKLMVDDTFQERAEAEQKMRRARLDVTQLCSYFVGFEEWRSLRDQAQRAQGKAFNPRAFLDRALSFGGVALPSLRELVAAPSGR